MAETLVSPDAALEAVAIALPVRRTAVALAGKRVASSTSIR